MTKAGVCFAERDGPYNEGLVDIKRGDLSPLIICI